MGLLESPTGTGKTLALLAAALECQWACEQRRLSRARPATGSGSSSSDSGSGNGGSGGGSSSNSSGDGGGVDDFGGGDGGGGGCVETPRVVWVARTHDQLEHAVREFRRLPYRPMMSLRLSRERWWFWRVAVVVVVVVRQWWSGSGGGGGGGRGYGSGLLQW